MKRFEAWVFGWLHRPAPSGFVRRTAFWLFLLYLACLLASLFPVSGFTGSAFSGSTFSGAGHHTAILLSYLCLLALLPLCVFLFVQWLFGSFLWRVRNRLLVTYLLMGLAPVVLFATLTLISLYVFSGQFAIFAANAESRADLARLADESRTMAVHLADNLGRGGPLAPIPRREWKSVQGLRAPAPVRMVAFVDGKLVGESLSTQNTGQSIAQNTEQDTEQATGQDAGQSREQNQEQTSAQPADEQPRESRASSITEIPAWVQDGHFHGIIFDHGSLFLRAIESESVGTHRVTVVSSMPMDEACAERIAAGLGRVILSPSLDAISLATNTSQRSGSSVTLTLHDGHEHDAILNSSQLVEGGVLPVKKHFYDIPVSFVGPLAMRDWQSGRLNTGYLAVVSRPSLLYARLFDYQQNLNPSLAAGALIRDTLIALAMAFGLLELIAFYGAIRLNRTITRSIRDLYAATLAIDCGDLAHRIPIKRRDQLAALSQSFNHMAASLARLIDEQREKERLLSELSIAHEVQVNLFPADALKLPTLEVHGVCLPARSVSGDYYDYLELGQDCLGLAVGDISGKGISAALLMATLHSAVRAYRYSAQRVVDRAEVPEAKSADAQAGSQADFQPDARADFQPQFQEECGDIFAAPAHILTLLNQHLYASTPPEKYATLFLAHIDAQRGELLYTNGGQNPPLLLRSTGQVKRLDCGGTVVGLFEKVSYEQETLAFASGDLLIVYSDGVTEPENEFGEFGEARLLELVRRHAQEPLASISAHVMEALRCWIGEAEQPDDITLVLVRKE